MSTLILICLTNFILGPPHLNTASSLNVVLSNFSKISTFQLILWAIFSWCVKNVWQQWKAEEYSINRCKPNQIEEMPKKKNETERNTRKMLVKWKGWQRLRMFEMRVRNFRISNLTIFGISCMRMRMEFSISSVKLQQKPKCGSVARRCRHGKGKVFYMGYSCRHRLTHNWIYTHVHICQR